MQQAHPGSVVEEEVRAAARRELELLAPARPRPVRLSGRAAGGKLARGDGDLLAAGARLAQLVPYRWRHAVVQLLRAGSCHGSPRFLSQRGGLQRDRSGCAHHRLAHLLVYIYDIGCRAQ